MLKLVARFADRWNCPAGYESFEHKFNVLKQHCKDVGRDVNTIDMSEQLLVCIGQSDAEVEAKWKAAQMLKPFVTTGIKGTPKQLIEAAQKARRDGNYDVRDFLQRLCAAADARAVREGSDAGICVGRSEFARRSMVALLIAGCASSQPSYYTTQLDTSGGLGTGRRDNACVGDDWARDRSLADWRRRCGDRVRSRGLARGRNSLRFDNDAEQPRRDAVARRDERGCDEP